MMELTQLGNLFKCNKCGSCTSVCPLYQQTVYEGMAARGKLALLEAAVEGKLDASRAVRAKLEDCLLCGACASNCPSFVPTTDLFLEARASLARDLGIPLPIRLLLRALATPALMELGTPPLHLLQSLGVPGFVEGRLSAVLPDAVRAAARSAPPAPRRSFRSRVRGLLANGEGTRGTVAYFAGCFMNWGYVEAAEATRQILMRSGFRVEVPAVSCCGVPHRAYGDTQAALALARRNVEALEGYQRIVTDCASCGAALKEYRHLLAHDPAYRDRAAAVSSRVSDISEFLVKQEFPRPERTVSLRVTYHDPCHLVRGQGIKAEPRQLLKAIPGLTFVEMTGADVCCGAAGSFCVTHPALSEGVGSIKAQNILATGADVVVSGCPSCLTQLRAMLRARGATVRVCHPSELLAESYRDPGSPTSAG
ncbi:MAG TPA: (Fe-S)-binding protein [Candidatus Methylomirabilis sp.]|nr:(Fe-S)-binding protein [Candidatus Methylomirabilis sp.]